MGGAKSLRKVFSSMRKVMGKEKKRASVPELLQKLSRRSGAKCEGYKLGLNCTVELTEDSNPLIHHIDGNPGNNEMDNLILLCPKCHFGVIERLCEKRRKLFAEEVAESLDKSSFYKR
ncbi:MAG: HNH endonuclease [Candidatus Bathyarchaeota archaeon]|nr:MAG: HNH endonuclease [Candidatus Bathyarchaeota archaeon]